MSNFRQDEINKALEKYRAEIDRIDFLRKEIMVMEMTAWNELKYVLDEDVPKHPVNKHFYEVI